jgi:hypothetical protein
MAVLHPSARCLGPAKQILVIGSAIIRSLASKSLSLMLFGVPGLKKPSITIIALIAASIVLVSCGSYRAPSSRQQSRSRLTFRAFVSNPLQPTSLGPTPVLNIVDASKDVLSASAVSLSSSSIQPGLMAVSPNKKFTVVFSAANNSIIVISNAQEAVAQSSPITLPASTESMFVWIDSLTAFAAVPNAPVTGQPLGAVEVLNLSQNIISATLPVPGAHYVGQSHNGNRILAFGDNSDVVTVIAPSLIGTSTDPRTFVCPDGTPQASVTLCAPTANPVFDHPVFGIFSSDDTTAYILNCGPECGGPVGTPASITVLDMNTNTAGITIPVDGATIGLLSGGILYVAGTPPPPVPGANTCTGSTTSVTTCGRLDVVDVGSMTVTGSAIITDGYHNRMEMGANGQIFIGARNCTNINIPPSGSNPGEVRGCLSIFNTTSSNVVIPPDIGDVTGIQPILNRSVVYVVENGELRIYDTTTDKLQSKQIDIIGQAIDVKLVDF